MPLYLGQEGLSDRSIGLISTLAAVAGLAQFPVGDLVRSDRLAEAVPGGRARLAGRGDGVAPGWAPGVVWLAVLVVLFAENGICRAVIESLSGAEAASLARPGECGAALGALRFWKPIGIVAVALAGSYLADRYGVGSILIPLAGVQASACRLAPDPRDGKTAAAAPAPPARPSYAQAAGFRRPCALGVRRRRWSCYHAANAPGGVYLGLFLKRELQAPERLLAYAFVVSMVAWMLVVWPAGRLADRWGRRPLLIAGWTIMALRLALAAIHRRHGR